jgi:BolA protein
MSRMQSHNDRRARITAALAERFAPSLLSVIDESAQHAGHSGASVGGQSHYHVTLVSAAFAGQNRVQRSRRVNEALSDEFASGLHALSLTLRAPGEDPPG